MKKLKLTLFKYIQKRLQVGIDKLEPPIPVVLSSAEMNKTFHSLSPIGDADPEGEYAKAFSWALTNRKAADIKNIAITGSYGSGKSTVLKTFQNHNTNPDFSFLNISLATFKDETENKNPTEGTELLRLIELSILQQIFYREEDEKIPDSRFKKIKSFNAERLTKLSVALFLLGVATIQLYNKTFLEDIFGYQFYETSNIIITILCLVIVIPGYYFLIKKSIRAISSLTISKLNINNAEIEISDTISKSILNNHLDEILYFFEVTNYTVVIIEDLDRFEQTEIFTKLRELNLLINRSKKISRDIAFVYAVRDDMFKDRDRTKFFDFIIPVIPVINSSNSNEKLMEIVKTNGYQIQTDLIENISLFIDDMRLLYNITNEYYIYSKKLGKLNQDKLMSMVVYKNIYPNDFANLSKGEGKLYSVFHKKEDFVREKTKEIEEQIVLIQKELKTLDALLITDQYELRKIYIYKYIEKLPNISTFVMDGTDYDFSKVTEGDAFDYFIKDKANYNNFTLSRNYNSLYNQNSHVVPLKFSDIQKEVDPNTTYAERLKMLHDWNRDKKEELKTNLSELEIKKVSIRHHKIKDIIAIGGCKLDLDDKKQLQLVNILLRNGYIDEDYLDYLSIFYEGSITKEDREFLLNVKAQLPSDHDYLLHKIDKLIPKIDAVDFTKQYILNYNLLDYLLDKPNFKSQRASIFGVLVDESAVSLAFINGFIDVSTQNALFIKSLARAWPRMWYFLSQKSNYPKERLSVYFKLIFQYADVKAIKALADQSTLRDEIAVQDNFISLKIDAEKLKQIINTLDIKFESSELSSAPAELAKYVYEQNHYLLNEKMVLEVMRHYGSFEEELFYSKNYTSILSSGCTFLAAYINQNIETYVNGLYLKLPSNKQEDQVPLLHLLNHEKLSISLKKLVIDQLDTKLVDLETIEEVETGQYLLDKSKIEANWKNLIYYYHESEDLIDEHFLNFINLESNAQLLSSSRINVESLSTDLEMVKKFLVALLLEEKVELPSYDLILNAIPYSYNALSFRTLSKEKVQLLVEKRKLSLTVSNYNLLRLNFNGIHMMLAEQKLTEFMQKLEEYVIEEPETFVLLSSGNLSITRKNELIEHVGDEMLQSTRVATLLGTLSIESSEMIMSKALLLHILTKTMSQNQRLTLLLKKAETLSKAEIFSVLSAMRESYREIAIPGRRPKLDQNALNWELANYLQRKQYIKSAKEESGKIRISTFRQ